MHNYYYGIQGGGELKLGGRGGGGDPSAPPPLYATLPTSIPFCPRVFSEEEMVLEAISDGLLSASIYPNSSPDRSRANFGYDMYLSVITCRRISFASNCNVPSSKSCITSGSKVSTCICMCVCMYVCVCVCVCIHNNIFCW